MAKNMKTFYALKDKHPDRILLFRGYSFYEAYQSDAIKLSKLLNLVVTQVLGTDVKMVAFPHRSLDTYLPRIIKAGYLVGICDSLEERKTLAKRGI